MNEKYSPNSPVLIVITDTFHKVRKDESEKYDPNTGIISSKISDENKQNLKQNRQEVFKRLKGNEIKWRDCEEELALDIDLKMGKDFFGNDSEARYLPAIYRFSGDLFEGLGDDGKQKLQKSHHHILILTALYGILQPLEPIQYYACQFGDKNLAYEIWTRNNDLYKIIIDYIQKYGIKRIFDFTSCEVPAYHECIDWDSVKKITGTDVLHCYHRYAMRDQALKPFGVFIKNKLLSESSDSLLAIKLDSTIDDVKFNPFQKLTESETLNRLIDNGENDKVEFKSSSLWSINLTQMDISISESKEIKKYQKNASKIIIARSIASFLNSNGGELLIGVREDRLNNKIIINGIEEEYSKLRQEDRNPDGYRRMITYDIVKKYIPDIFDNFSNFIHFSFNKKSGKTPCWIHIEPSKKPIFVEVNGEELFFTRIDASTQMFAGKKLGDYIFNHFK